MKIVQINCVYGDGSTGKLTRDIHLSLLSNGIESRVAYPFSNRKWEEKGLYSFSSTYESHLSAAYRRLTGRQFDGAFFQTKRLIRYLVWEKPDVVHIQCINGNSINVYMLLSFLAKNNISTVYTLHAEFPYTGGCGHAFECEKWKSGCGKCPILREATQSVCIDGTSRTWRQQYRAYQLFEEDKLHIVAVSPWLLNRAKESMLLRRFPMIAIYNGVDTSIFRYRKSNIRKTYNILPTTKLILHVTAIFNSNVQDLKGGRYIIELAEQNTDYVFVVAANHGKVENLPSNVIYLGRTKTQIELAEWYSAADLTIVTSKRETFSMPVAESMCCGTPVVGFKAGGPETIAIPEYSTFVEYGDIKKLNNAIHESLERLERKDIIERAAQNVYGKDVMCSEYLKLYREILEKTMRG